MRIINWSHGDEQNPSYMGIETPLKQFFPEELVLMNAETEPFTAMNVWLCSFWTQVVSTILQHTVIIRLVSLL